MVLLKILIVVAIIATVFSLGAGVVSMGRGGDFDEQHSTQLMFARVGCQALTLLLLIGAIILMSGG